MVEYEHGEQPLSGIWHWLRGPATRWRWLAAVALLASLLTAIAYRQSHVVLQFELLSDVSGRVQVFQDARGAFSESASNWVSVSAGQPSTVVLDSHGAGIAQLRIDPPSGTRIQACGWTMNGARADGQMRVVATSAMDAAVVSDCVRMQSPSSVEDPHTTLVLDGNAGVVLQHAQRWWRMAPGAMLLTFTLWAWLGWLALHRERWTDTLSTGIAWADARAHRWLVYLMLGFGMGYLVLTPPGAVPDEPAHLAKVVRIAAGVPFGDSNNKALPDVIAGYGDFRNYPVNKKPFAPASVAEIAASPLRCELSKSDLPHSARGYFPLQYLLPALVLKATCAVGGSFGGFLYLSRLLNLLLATFFVAAGVRFAVRGRWALFLVALLPMTLFELASISADSLSLALMLAWLGLLSGIHGGRVQLVKATPWLYGLGFGLALCKGGGLWMLLAFVFCRQAYISAGKPFTPALARFVLLPGFVGIAWGWHAAGLLAIRSGVDHVANVHLLSAHPLGYVALLVRTLSVHGESLWRSMIGILGWLDVSLPAHAYLMVGVALPLSLWSNAEDRLSPAIRWLAATLALTAIFLTGVPLFLYWTLPGSQTIEGLQGRYFLNIVAFVLVWLSFRAGPQLRVACVGWIVATVLWVNVLALHALYVAYFVTGRTG